MLADRHWEKGAFGPLPKYWHFASTTCRRCLQLAGRVYLWCTVSTDPRPPSSYVRVNDVSGPSLGEGGLWPPSQILAIRVYNMPIVSTISRYDSVRRVVQCRTVSYSVVQASYDIVRRVVQCRTRCRGPTHRGCTTRRTVSYKVSGPDASGMYDASGGVGARRVVKCLL